MPPHWQASTIKRYYVVSFQYTFHCLFPPFEVYTCGLLPLAYALIWHVEEVTARTNSPSPDSSVSS
jgi:hypothetical protein